MLFFSSTYCKLECFVSILFLAYVVKSQQEVTSVEVIKMEKFYKDALVKNKFEHLTSFWFAEDTQVPKIFLSLACWFWLLADVSFLHHALQQNCAFTHKGHPNPLWLNLILKYEGVFQVIENNWLYQVILFSVKSSAHEMENTKRYYLYIWNIFARVIVLAILYHFAISLTVSQANLCVWQFAQLRTTDFLTKDMIN